MEFIKFESVLYKEELLTFKGVTDWMQAVLYKTASDQLERFIEDSRADYSCNFDAALDVYEYSSDNLSGSISDRVHGIYLYIEFGSCSNVF